MAPTDDELKYALSSPVTFYETFVDSKPDTGRFFGDCFGLVDTIDGNAKSDAEMTTGEKMLVELCWTMYSVQTLDLDTNVFADLWKRKAKIQRYMATVHSDLQLFYNIGAP